MSIHLIRHGHAGKRGEWTGDDTLRPLSEKGRVQAELIGRDLAEVGIDQLWSSQYVRCVQTLEPLGERLELAVAHVPELAEGASGGSALDALLAAVASGHTVAASSHGDVIPAMIRVARHRGATLTGPDQPRKGGRYQLQVVDGCVGSITYVERPDQPA